mmetsp:Transcript_5087/g.15062  ORF Transcript_5087/g.15062 Transcript_5087/m.15062 type:complete len:100 (+) Transcript_5087:318-617(+)
MELDDLLRPDGSEKKFKSFELQLRELEAEGIDDPWTDGVNGIKNLEHIEVIADAAAYDAAQALYAAGRSIKTEFLVWPTTAGLAVVNHFREETCQLGAS